LVAIRKNYIDEFIPQSIFLKLAWQKIITLNDVVSANITESLLIKVLTFAVRAIAVKQCMRKQYLRQCESDNNGYGFYVGE
jgi:hypothetical protein